MDIILTSVPGETTHLLIMDSTSRHFLDHYTVGKPTRLMNMHNTGAFDLGFVLVDMFLAIVFSGTLVCTRHLFNMPQFRVLAYHNLGVQHLPLLLVAANGNTPIKKKGNTGIF